MRTDILGGAGSGSDSLKSDAKIVPISARPQPEFHGFRPATFSISARSGNLFKKERVGGRFPGPPSLS